MGELSFPRKPEDVTTDWLADAVGAPVGSFEAEQIGIGVGILGRLYRLRLSGDERTPASVVAKFPTLDEGARMNVVEPLRFYEKEVRFYQEVAGTSPVSTPEVFAAEFDPATGDFVLLLEDLCDRRMEDQTTGCREVDAATAVDAMVELHAHWWQSERFASLPWLPVYSDPPYPEVIAGMYKQAWPRALEVLGDQLSPVHREFGERYVDLVPWFLREATHEPHTLCHGDFRLDNLFFGGSAGHAHVTVVDWQICFKGRAGYDLAYFLSQSLSTEDRRAHEDALTGRYTDGLAARGVDYAADEFDADYRRTVAYCFIYPIVSAGQIEFSNERQRELVAGMLDRATAAIDDVRALEILP